MDFIKKVITSVSTGGGLAVGFPYAIDDDIAYRMDGLPNVWQLHTGHHVNLKRVMTTAVFFP